MKIFIQDGEKVDVRKLQDILKVFDSLDNDTAAKVQFCVFPDCSEFGSGVEIEVVGDAICENEV